MAELNGKIATQTTSHNEVLRSTGDFPYLQANMEGPETVGVADVISLMLGDLLKIDGVSGKVAKYVVGDAEEIIGIVSDPYDSTLLNAQGLPAGHIDLYVHGSFIKTKIKMDDGLGARIAVDLETMLKARRMGLYLM